MPEPRSGGPEQEGVTGNAEGYGRVIESVAVRINMFNLQCSILMFLGKINI